MHFHIEIDVNLMLFDNICALYIQINTFIYLHITFYDDYDEIIEGNFKI